jgi:hypothetical protein
MNRIDTAFERARAEGRVGLFPYLTAGYPALDATERLAETAVESGADGLEFGVPFSDPLADGATMQRASEVALANGASLAWTLERVQRLRSRLDVPLVLMTYYNPVHHYGIDRFVEDAVSVGVDGIIVPDLPSIEAGPLAQAADPRDHERAPFRGRANGARLRLLRLAAGHDRRPQPALGSAARVHDQCPGTRSHAAPRGLRHRAAGAHRCCPALRRRGGGWQLNR